VFGLSFGGWKKKQRDIKRRDPYDGLRPWSAITHGLGAGLALLGTVLLLVKTVLCGADAWRIVSFSIYGASMFCLYLASTLYHSVNTTPGGRIGLRKYDHISIYLLIAGSYTPVCLIVLRGVLGWGLFTGIWLLALLGIVLTLCWIDCPRGITTAIYLVMGWLALLALWPLGKALGAEGMIWLISGGVLYTVGGVLYAVKWPGRNNPRFGCHEIFHVFILLGSLCHYFMMYRILV